MNAITFIQFKKRAKKATQKDVAKYLGISVNSYRDKEKGRREFTQDEIFKLSKYFELPIDDIFLPIEYHFGTERTLRFEFLNFKLYCLTF